MQRNKLKVKAAMAIHNQKMNPMIVRFVVFIGLHQLFLSFTIGEGSDLNIVSVSTNVLQKANDQDRLLTRTGIEVLPIDSNLHESSKTNTISFILTSETKSDLENSSLNDTQVSVVTNEDDYYYYDDPYYYDDENATGYDAAYAYDDAYKYDDGQYYDDDPSNDVSDSNSGDYAKASAGDDVLLSILEKLVTGTGAKSSKETSGKGSMAMGMGKGGMGMGKGGEKQSSSSPSCIASDFPSVSYIPTFSPTISSKKGMTSTKTTTPVASRTIDPTLSSKKGKGSNIMSTLNPTPELTGTGKLSKGKGMMMSTGKRKGMMTGKGSKSSKKSDCPEISSSPSSISSASPTRLEPTITPSSSFPTFRPFESPTAIPTLSSSDVSTTSSIPIASSNLPTLVVSSATTIIVTDQPSASPAASPSTIPTISQTLIGSDPQITDSPSIQKSDTPTFGISAFPTLEVTESTTLFPSFQPTVSKSAQPTISPSSSPSKIPSFQPSILPSTDSPSSMPSKEPTSAPTKTPICAPTSGTCVRNAAALQVELDSANPNAVIGICENTTMSVTQPIEVGLSDITICCITLGSCTLISTGVDSVLLGGADSLTLQDLRFVDGVANGFSGGNVDIAGNGDHVITRCEFIGGTVTGATGGNLNVRTLGTLTITGSNFTGGRSITTGTAITGSGGGLSVIDAAQVTIIDSDFSANSAEAQGGALFFTIQSTSTTSMQITIQNSTIRDNLAVVGAGFYFENIGTLPIVSILVVEFTSNIATDGAGAGAIIVDASTTTLTLTLTGNTGSGNTAQAGTALCDDFFIVDQCVAVNQNLP